MSENKDFAEVSEQWRDTLEVAVLADSHQSWQSQQQVFHPKGISFSD
jgi:hypothetical protein